MVEALGVTIMRNVKLIEIEEDEDDGLESIVFKDLDMAEVNEDDEDEIDNLENPSENDESMKSENAGTGEHGSEQDGENEADQVK